MLLTALSGYIFVEKKLELAKENREKAFQVAEAGLEYYRWHLAHWPDDLQDGTGHAGPYTHTVPDPEGGNLGSYTLDISGGTFCGKTNTVDITVTGWSLADPSYKRVLFARYTRPSVAGLHALAGTRRGQPVRHQLAVHASAQTAEPCGQHLVRRVTGIDARQERLEVLQERARVPFLHCADPDRSAIVRGRFGDVGVDVLDSPMTVRLAGYFLAGSVRRRLLAFFDQAGHFRELRRDNVYPDAEPR